MTGSRRWQILALITMALVGVGFGIWLLREGFVGLGCAWVGLFLWRGQQFAVWFIAPARAPSDFTPPLTSRWQSFLLSIVCLLGAAVCAVGIYLWRIRPAHGEESPVFLSFLWLRFAPPALPPNQSPPQDVPPHHPPPSLPAPLH